MNKSFLLKTLTILVVVTVFYFLFKSEKSAMSSPMPITGEEAALVAEQWAITYGKADWNHISDIVQTSDGGFLVVAWTEVDNSDNWDGWVMKLDQTGAVTWHKSYGGSGRDTLEIGLETSDGHFVVAGNLDLLSAGGFDAWVMNLNPDGSIAWQKTYGSAMWEYLYSMDQTSDGGFILGGEAEGGLWVFKLGNNGDIEWQKVYGGGVYEGGGIVRQTSDGGYIVSGITESFGQGQSDIWVLKVNSVGDITWQKTYGGVEDDSSFSIQETSDGGYILGGEEEIYNVEVGRIIKMDGNGDIIWQKYYGDIENGGFGGISSIYETSGGGYIIAGNVYLSGDDTGILKTDSNGTPIWYKVYGGENSDFGRIARETSDGGYILGGQTHSFGAGGADIWILKLSSNGSAGACNLAKDIELVVTDSEMVAEYTSVAAQNGTAVAKTSTILPVDVTAQTETLCPIALEQKCFLPVIRK